MKTTYKKPSATPTWFVLDAKDLVLGRIATRIATVLRGRHRADYVPFWRTGDHVIVLNADKIKVTGNKMAAKEYFRHTGYFGHLRSATMEELMAKDPTHVLRLAVKGMLPKNKTRDALMKNLHIFAGETHPHEAQKPVSFPQ